MTDLPFDEFSFLSAQAAEIGAGRVPPVRRRRVSLPDGRSVSALQYGDPATGEFKDPVVTFLHGAGLNAHTWDTTVLALGLPTLAIDLPGHGDSSWRADARYTAATLEGDVTAVIAAETNRPQVLVGQSLGGLTAAAVAAAYPELVRALVVVDITPGVDPDGDAAMIRAFFAGPADWASRDELVDRALSFGLGGSRAAATSGVYLNSRVRPDGRVEWKHHFAHLANAHTADAVPGTNPVAAVLGEAGWRDLARVQVPVTLVRGDRGFVTGAGTEEFARRLPEASVITVSSGHNVQEELPRELARLVAEVVGNE